LLFCFLLYADIIEKDFHYKKLCAKVDALVLEKDILVDFQKHTEKKKSETNISGKGSLVVVMKTINLTVSSQVQTLGFQGQVVGS